MKTSILFLTLGLLFSPFLVHADEAYRTFTNKQGQQMQARIVEVKDGMVTIERDDRRQFTVDASMFVTADQQYIASWKPASEMAPAATSDVTVEQINEALGHPVFADTHLWDDDPADAAKRLRWPAESKTEFVSSYRLYPNVEYKVLNAHPYSAAMYGAEDTVTGLSLVYANKGDSSQLAIGNQDPLDALNDAMEADLASITEALAAVLGEPDRQRFGEGTNRQTVSRWDWNNHAFLLAEQEDEYVSLGIYPQAFADEGGRVEREKDLVVRERTRENVIERENGDVVVGNVPMVDQGPKGYCAPATFERCMRYLGIPADMYLLAMAGQTGLGGGTYTAELTAAIGSDIKRKGGDLETFTGKLDLRKIARYIDEGLPVMWGMASTDAFNEIASQRTKDRQTVTDWGDYAARLRGEVRDTNLIADDDYGHLTLIVGYNEETEEIAFSDSWGPRYQERWISLEEAQAVNREYFHVVTF